MIKYILITLLFLFSYPSAFSKQYKYELAICTIFRDDAKYLTEWVEFHQKQGVQHFYLYDNLSIDNPKERLEKYVSQGLVTIIDWPYESQGQDFFAIQCSSYMHCVQSNIETCRWIAFLDSDEFLFCPNKMNLRKFINKYQKYGAISAYWRMYGTSGINVPEGSNIVDYLVYRARDDYHGHKIMKTIAQPKFVKSIINPHVAFLKGNKPHKQIEINDLRINHYWSRDIDFFYNIKLPRREKWYKDRDIHIKMESEMNEVYDPILAN